MSSAKLSQIEASLRSALGSAGVPLELQDSLVDAVREMQKSYASGHHRPAELGAGDFTEAAMRILQHLATGKYTALGKTLPSMPVFLQNMQGSQLDDSLRIHVPRQLQGIYDVRSRRGVGHLPGPVSANRPDAELLLMVSRWVLAEFVRILSPSSNHTDAQKAVDLLAVHDSPLVQDFEGAKRVISTKALSVSARILILLFNLDSDACHEVDLVEWVRAPRKSVIQELSRLDRRDMIHRFPDGRATLTSLGRIKASELVAELSA